MKTRNKDVTGCVRSSVPTMPMRVGGSVILYAYTSQARVARAKEMVPHHDIYNPYQREKPHAAL